MENDLTADLEKFMQEKMKPIADKMKEQERVRYQQFLQQHSEKFELLKQKHDSYISQLITLESAIFGAIVIFTNSQQVTIWLILAIISIILSLILGVWTQSLSIQSSYWAHEFSYNQELNHHWFVRELWKDDTVKTEKEILEPHLKCQNNQNNKTISTRILETLKLDADFIETIFKVSFIVSLVLLILHLVFKSPATPNS